MVHENVTIPPDASWLKYWKWLRFVPINFATMLPVLGFFIGRFFNDPFGSGVGVFVGMITGVPLQLIKGFCRSDDQGLDLDQRRNKLQFHTGMGVSLVGGVTVWFLEHAQLAQNNSPVWLLFLKVFLGWVAGFASGVFLTGAYLAILDSALRVREWFIAISGRLR